MNNNEKPIIFNGEMVRAILKGRKTQTRRPIKQTILDRFESLDPDDWGCGIPSYETEMGQEVLLTDLCPFGYPGDRLWVRETWAKNPIDGGFVYRATDPDWGIEMDNWQWKPSIHMKREACRLTLQVSDVRVERIQDISEVLVRKDAGIYTNLTEFKKLWDSIYSKKYPWKSNPWVWCISFKVI